MTGRQVSMAGSRRIGPDFAEEGQGGWMGQSGVVPRCMSLGRHPSDEVTP